MSLHTCIYGNEELKNAKEKYKLMLIEILHENKKVIRDDINKSNLKRILKLFYMIDCINKKLKNENKIVIKNIENDKQGRKLIKEYIDTSIKLHEIKNKLKQIEFDGGYNPLSYSSNYDEYYNNNNLVEDILNEHGINFLYSFNICKSDITENISITKIKEILRKIESEEK